jgi:hypothetical protein
VTKRAGAEALIVCASPFFNAHRKRVVDLAEQHRLPAIYEHREDRERISTKNGTPPSPEPCQTHGECASGPGLVAVGTVHCAHAGPHLTGTLNEQSSIPADLRLSVGGNQPRRRSALDASALAV